MSHHAEEAYDLYDETIRAARKQHACAACREEIQVGHRYAVIFVLYDGRPKTFKRCLRCQKIHEHLRNVCREQTEGEFWPAERLDCGEEYRQHWGEDPPPEIAALAFTTADEMQRAT